VVNSTPSVMAGIVLQEEIVKNYVMYRARQRLGTSAAR